MSDITLALDVPRCTINVPRTNRFDEFKEQVLTRYQIDLSHYRVEKLSDGISSPVNSQRDFEQAIERGKLVFQAKLQTHAKPTCLVCRKSFSSKSAYESHFSDCRPVNGLPANSQRPAVGIELQGFLVQRKSAGLQSLITAL